MCTSNRYVLYCFLQNVYMRERRPDNTLPKNGNFLKIIFIHKEQCEWERNEAYTAHKEEINLYYLDSRNFKNLNHKKVVTLSKLNDKEHTGGKTSL